jgi:hypothetical protein
MGDDEDKGDGDEEEEEEFIKKPRRNARTVNTSTSARPAAKRSRVSFIVRIFLFYI